MGPVTNTARPGRSAAGRLQTIVVVAIAVVVIAVLAWSAMGGSGDGFTKVEIAPDTGVTAPTVGSPPTPFSGLTYDGKPASLADYAGQPVWLNFGGSWCRDCRVEMPELVETYNRYKADGLVVLGVFINEPASDTADYARRAAIPFPIISDASGKIASAYRLMGVPTHVFIGRDGLIKEIKIGALAKDEMEAAVAAILAGESRTMSTPDPARTLTVDDALGPLGAAVMHAVWTQGDAKVASVAAALAQDGTSTSARDRSRARPRGGC